MHEGPYLNAAVLCENIVEDSNGMLSAVRMLDTISIAVQHPNEVSKASPANIGGNLLLSFKTGESRGNHRLKVELVYPNGRKKPAFSQVAKFPKEAYGGVNIKAKVGIGVFESGLYWFDVLLDGKRVTRVPLNISIVRFGEPAVAAPSGENAKPANRRTGGGQST